MAQQHWLIKSEPYKYSYENLVRDGRTTWDGVRNYTARNNLRKMKVGDSCLFYHSGESKAVVGVARVAREAYADPSTEEDFSAVDVEPVKSFKHPVTLAEMRNCADLKGLLIFRQPRLSVVSVTSDEFDAVVKLGQG